MKPDMGPRVTAADGIMTRGNARLPRGRASKGGGCAKDTIQRFRAAGSAGAMLLILGLSAWGQGIVGDTGGDPGARTAGTPGALEGLAEGAPAAPEGAKKAVGWAVGLKSGGNATILHTTDGGQTWERQGTPGKVGDSGNWRELG